jgi:hypothetical protein
MTIPIKNHWLDRAIQVYNFHIHQCKAEPKWTIAKTAEALNRSIGSVSQDIALANWAKTHEKQLRRLKSMRMALDYIKTKEKEKMKEIEL